jgi:isoleucyl-tRNA synthetase
MAMAAVVIWTTTPWTLPANQAAAVHPEMEYVIAQTEGEHPERPLLPSPCSRVMLRYGIERHRDRDCAGAASWHSSHPFMRARCRSFSVSMSPPMPALAAHTAPGHGRGGDEAGEQTAVDNPVGGDGGALPGTELFAGEHAQGERRVIEVSAARHAGA